MNAHRKCPSFLVWRVVHESVEQHSGSPIGIEGPRVAVSRADTLVAPAQLFAPYTPLQVNLNPASVTGLKSLREIGPALARRIVAGRPNRSVDDPLEIKGIGEHRFAEIRQHVAMR